MPVMFINGEIYEVASIGIFETEELAVAASNKQKEYTKNQNLRPNTTISISIFKMSLGDINYHSFHTSRGSQEEITPKLITKVLDHLKGVVNGR